MRKYLAIVVLLAGLGLLSQAFWLEAKAWLGQQLIARAWAQSLQSGQPVKPWPWADTWPVARLSLPNGEVRYVLHGVSGHALAFGPGHLTASAKPGQTGSTVIAGHQDSHFRVLESVSIDELLQIEDHQGQSHTYRVEQIRIVDSSQERLQLQWDTPELRLISCYPFDSLTTGGDLRYVVSAIPVWADQPHRLAAGG